jgi:glycosyltransferase involved in cell wall biosynthesis
MIQKPHVVYISFGRGRRSFQRDSLFLETVLKNHISVVAHYHGGDMPILMEQLKKNNLNKIITKVENIFKKIGKVIVLSKDLANDFQGIVSTDKIKVIPNCFRIPPGFQLPLTRSISEKKGERKDILFLSNVNPEKGFFESLKCIGILKSRGYNVHFTFVGSFISDNEYSARDLKRQMDRFIEEYKITDIVEIKGPLYGTQKWNEYIKADIFVLPTYYKTEGLPMSIIEAMAAGCAIVTTPYRGIVDLLDDGVEGLYIRQRDAKDLADKIELLLRDSAKLNQMKNAAQKRALRDFTEDKYVASILRVIKEIL